MARRSTPLTREEILRSAIAIIDAEGLDALSMRRLARDLGVEAMTLYHHFANKDAIFDGITNAIMREMRLPDPLPRDWVELLVEMVVAFRETLTGHPNAMPLLITRPLGPPEDAMVTPATVLAEQGFDPDSLIELYQALMALTFGHALVSGMARVPSPGEALPAEVTPPVLGDEGFRRSARFLIEGFAADVSGAGAEGTDAE